jgi:ABC-type sugar transport system ATPase subunit
MANAGEVFGLLGSNGAGKSTTININATECLSAKCLEEWAPGDSLLTQEQTERANSASVQMQPLGEAARRCS